jgi:hypothetical protein
VGKRVGCGVGIQVGIQVLVQWVQVLVQEWAPEFLGITRIIEVWAIECSGCFFVHFHDNLGVHRYLRLEDLESLQF